MEIISIPFIDKLRSLVYSLTQSKEEFEMVADEVEDPNLRTALNGLSMESCQYANELCMQLKTLGLEFRTMSSSLPDELDDLPVEQFNPGPGNELSYICNRNENFIVAAYRNLLAEMSLFPGLREIMTYQMDALNCAFMKIRLLNSARFS